MRSSALREFSFENKAFWRNPAAAFFTFVFPLIFLFLFPVIFGEDAEFTHDGNAMSGETFYVPAISVFAIISATYTNNAMTLLFAREEGVLKRKRGTPLPARVYMAGRILQSISVTALLVLITLLAGRLFFDVPFPTDTLPAFITTLVVGTFAFCALGIAITGIIPNVDAGPPVVNASVLPLMFISDVFIPSTNAPEWLVAIGKVFPIKHFSDALFSAFLGFGDNGFEWGSLGVIALWGLAGALIAVKTFRWEPKH